MRTGAMTALLTTLLLVSAIPDAVTAGESRRRESFHAKVTRIVDGDTLVVEDDAGRVVKVRLSTIDCPESRQDYGRRATRFARKYSHHREVTIHVVGRDRYARLLGHVALPDGSDLGERLLQAGLAWIYPLRGRRKRAVNRNRRLAAMHRRLNRLEQRARDAGRGLWREEAPLPPWAWRRGYR